MDIHPGTERYEAFHRLGLMHRAEMADSQAPDFSAGKLSKHTAAAIKEFRALTRDLDEMKVEKIMVTVAKATKKLKWS